MFTKYELRDIIAVSVVVAFSITLFENLNGFLLALASMFVIIFFNTSIKKATAEYFEMGLETKLWQFKRFGHKPIHKFSKPIPAGLIFPLIFSFIFAVFKGFTWMASLVYSVNPKPYKVARRHGYYSYSETSESEIGLIAAAGIFVNLLLALAGYLIGYPEFAKYNIWFAFFNLIPISNLDGNKIFFGNYLIWSILAIITLLTLAGTFVIA
ncbi:MAG: hypothetical protein ABEI74_03185 [Candidatus Pacearchaeota archaeon]